MNFEALIEQYGYAAVLIGTFFEGETILVIAGFLSHQGYLMLRGVIAAAFTGAMLGDQLYFHIGRWKGQEFIASRPRLVRHRHKVESFLHKHQVLLILGFRFVYGLRTVTPLILGATTISAWRFFMLNTAGALLWSVAIGLAGFYLGSALEATLGRVKDYELLVIGILAGGALALWAVHFLVRRHRTSSAADSRSA